MFDFSGIFGVERFKIWCQKVLPTVYDDSLSYMELLCKVLKVLEEYGKGSAEIAEQVVNLAKDLEEYKLANDADIDGVKTTVDEINTALTNLSESVDRVIGAIGGKTAYLGEHVNMEDVPADAVIVGGNGTEEEPYNAFEAGGSKDNGGWVRVGSEVVPESDFKKLEAVVHDITEQQAGNLKTFAVGETRVFNPNYSSASYMSFEGDIPEGFYVVTLYREDRSISGVINRMKSDNLKSAGTMGHGITIEYDEHVGITLSTSTEETLSIYTSLEIRRIY